MNIFSITTYNRLPFLQKTLDTFYATRTGKAWRVIVADDGSTDGTIEWLKSQQCIELILNRRKGIAAQKNCILRHIENVDYNIHFMCDDDLVFLETGWVNAYTKALKTVPHLSYYDLSWNSKDNLKVPIIQDNLVCNSLPTREQGALLVFTKTAHDKAGFIDTKNFVSAFYHSDYSRRIYKGFGLNSNVIFDIINSNQYVTLNKDNYISASEEERYKLWDTTANCFSKLQLCKNNEVYKAYYESELNFLGMTKSILNKQFDKVYCINLLRRPDRKAKMQLLADVLNLEITFVEAVDGKGWEKKGTLNGGQLACIQSHIAVWKQAVKDNVQTFLVIEDDILFHKELNNFNFEELPTWDVLYLGACQFTWDFPITDNYYPVNHDTLATHAIAYTSKAVKRILKIANVSEIEYPIDNWLARILPGKYKAYCIYPNLIIQQKGESDIKAASCEYLSNMRWEYNNYVGDESNNQSLHIPENHMAIKFNQRFGVYRKNSIEVLPTDLALKIIAKGLAIKKEDI